MAKIIMERNFGDQIVSIHCGDIVAVNNSLTQGRALKKKLLREGYVMDTQAESCEKAGAAGE